MPIAIPLACQSAMLQQIAGKPSHVARPPRKAPPRGDETLTDELGEDDDEGPFDAAGDRPESPGLGAERLLRKSSLRILQGCSKRPHPAKHHVATRREPHTMGNEGGADARCHLAKQQHRPQGADPLHQAACCILGRAPPQRNLMPSRMRTR